MSNTPAVRDAIAKSVNRELRIAGVIRADQLLRSYQRLVSILVEYPEIVTASALMRLVRLRMVMRSTAVPPEVAAPVEPEVAAPLAEAKKKRASKKVVSRPGESIRDMLDLANSPCYLDRNA